MPKLTRCIALALNIVALITLLYGVFDIYRTVKGTEDAVQEQREDLNEFKYMMMLWMSGKPVNGGH